jgi:uncharacterized coiled-coil DUF342 family protein
MLRTYVIVSAVAGASSESVTPVEKVMDLLKSLSAKVTEEGKAEAAQYDKFACFCKEQADDKLYNINKSDKKLSKLDARINKLTTEVSELNGEISDLSKQITEFEGEIARAVEVSDTAKEGYNEQATELKGCIDAVARAIKAMKSSKKNQVGDSDLDFAQLRRVSANMAPTAKLQVLTQLQKLAEPGKPPAYEYQSNDIIATLQELKATFIGNLKELDEQEFARNSAFEKEKLAMENEKKFAEQDKAEHVATVEKKTEEKENAQKNQKDEQQARDSDQSFLDVLTGDCETKAAEWDQRSKVRAGELSTFNDALQALKTGVAPNYGANKKLNLIAQSSHQGHWQWVEAKPRPHSFLQIRSEEGAPQKVLKLLSSAAARLRSDVLSAAVMKITVSADHFVKVRGLIKDLIERLEDNAAAEQTHKAFCDDAMAKATDSRDEANSVIESKVGALNVASSEINQLQADIQDLDAAIAANLKALNEATELRNDDKAENEKAIDESTAGKEAVEYAITVLQQFYEEGGGAELLQATYTPPNADRSGKTVGDMAPATFSGEYHGAKSNADGIIGLLDVILSDFERTLSATQNQEEKDQAAYEAMEKDTKEDNDAKKQEIEGKESQLTDLEDEVITLTEDKKNGIDQLTNAKDELSKLKPMCLEGEETYAQRVQKREKEIEALKEAMTILDDWQK